MTRLFNAITAGGQKRPYGLTLCLEIEDMIPHGSEAVKCTDSLYLVRTGDGVKLFDSSAGKLSDFLEYPETNRADGFVTELSLAPGVVLKAEFASGQLVLEEEKLPVTVRDLGNNVLLVEAEEGDVILIDVSRFLLYALADGNFICGYIEV